MNLPRSPAPRATLVSLTHLIYGLHALAAAIGITTSATVLGSFVFGLPSLIAVGLNYWFRSEVRGTWLEGHFAWQIRTFWAAALWALVLFLCTLTIVLIPLVIGGMILLGLWIIYRVARGWLRLRANEAMPQ